MEIKTKYDVGQEIYVIRYGGKVEAVTVRSITIWRGKEISYDIGLMQSFGENSDLLYTTKEEAIQMSIKKFAESIS